MGKEAPGSDHEVYGPAEERKTPLSDEEIANMRREFAESGAQIGKRRWDAAKAAEDQQSASDESDSLTSYEPSDNSSAAYAELGRRGPASDSLVNAADKMTHDTEEARILAAAKFAREERDARVNAQRAVNADGIAKVREAMGLPSKEADSIEGVSPGARSTLDAAGIKGERDRSEHQAALAAQAAREWPKDQLIQTPSQAVEVGKKLAEEQAKAEQADEARGIIDKQTE